METSRACSPELMKTSRDEGKRSLIMYKKEEEEEKDEDDDDKGKIESELGYRVEHGRKSRVISDAYSQRVPKPGSLSAPPSCQVDGCHADLSNARAYHRRHKVCEHHAKAPKVLFSGHEQRFCQQCSRFHELSEFDNSQRSCRRRLAWDLQKRLARARERLSSDYLGKAAPGSQLVAPLTPTLPPTQSHGPSGSGSIRPGFMAGTALMGHILKPDVAFKCPRCHSTNTEFCYFINCDPSQPRHLCKTCRRYWTRGGTLRNVPAGGGCRRNQRSKGSSSKSPPVSSDRQTGSATSTTSASSNSASASDIVGQAYYGSSNQMGGVGDLSSMFDHTKIPVSILNLAADLAINQLLQILLSGDDHSLNIRRIMICTRNDDERRQVFEKLMKDIDNMPCFNEIFHEVLWVDESLCQSQVNVKAHAQKQINLQLRQLSGISQSNHQSMIRKKYLVLGFDGYDEKTVDMGKLNLAGGDEAIMVLITTESRKQEEKDKGTIAMDLAISTNDHLLPCRVFCQTVGNELVFSSSALQEIAVRIVQECGGHLLAIVLVAKSLESVKDVKLWELALNKLSFLNPPYDMNMFQGVSRVMVTTFINFIWNDMNQILKLCLTSCLFIPHIKTGKLSNELMHHWISWQLTDDGEGLHNLTELVERSVLIQDQSNDKYVRLPEDIHAILHSLNTLTPLFMKKPGLGLTEPPKDEEWHSVVHLELANNKLSELPLSPSSPELRVLMLQGNVDLTRIPNTFFVKMPLLTILDLSYTSVRELPDSLFELEQLREMYLKVCESYMKLSPKIGKLKKLEKLDLEGTQIIHLPEEIQELTNLQSLFLCFYEYRGKKGKQYTCSKIIPSQVISKLKGLKHLSIDVNPDDERWYENVQDILPEILGLEYLLTLSLYIPHLEILKFIPNRIAQVDFKLIVGRHMQRIISSTPSTAEAKFKQSGCSLKFVNGDHVPKEIKRLARHSKALFLERHKTIKNLSEFQMMNLEQLRVCILAECREMQTVVDGRQLIWGNEIFSHLLYLYISHMKSLRSIWEGPMPPRCFFGMLKSLVLQNCPELTTVFTMDFLGNLSLLKELMVKDCPKVTTLISDMVKDCPKVTTLISDGSFKHKGEVFLPKLRKIMLLHLPELITISNGCYIGPRLNNMAIYDCPKLQSLSRSELSSQTLKIIKGEIKWWDQLQWSKEEWGISQRPSKFDRVFSSIDNQVDIMTQIWNDDDDIDDAAEDITPLQTIFELPKQSADNISRVTFSVPIETAELGDFVLDDGYRWRKYGQKTMVGSKNPRSYYKCTHVGCPVRKYSQQSEKDPRKIEVCYNGIHTHTIPQPRRSLHELQSTGIEGAPLQSSSVTNASMNNQGDLRTQSGVDDEDIYSHQVLRPSSWRIFEEEKQIANTSSRRSDTCSQTSCVTNPTLTDSIDQSGKSAANADFVSFSPWDLGLNLL